MNPQLKAIYKKAERYLLMPNPDIIKTLCAFALSCRLPIVPLWLFIVSGPSTGKTQVLVLLEGLSGYRAVDDMSKNTLISGMKKFDGSASMLDDMPKSGGFLAFSDFTTLLSKNKEELGAILGQLRVVFDGKYSKRTGGQIAEKVWEGKAGLIAACTDSLYERSEDYADVGQRMIIYNLESADNFAVGKFKFDHMYEDRKGLRKELQTMMADYINSIELPTEAKDLPKFDEETKNDLISLADITVTARSPITRNKYTQKQIFKNEREGIGRVLEQLMSLADCFAVQNEGWILEPRDKKEIYKTALDCIDPRKRLILKLLTASSMGGDLEQIADGIGYDKDQTYIHVEDLFSHGMIEKVKNYYGGGTKVTYKLKDKYKNVISKFENIQIENKELDPVELPEGDPFKGGI